MYTWIEESYPEHKIILYGRSLGSGVAARIASWHHPGMLILDSPYFSFYHNIKRYLFFIPLRWLMRYDLRTDQYLETADCPVHIIHGTKDRLIPFAQSVQLQKLFPAKIILHPIQNASHNNLPEYPEFYTLLYEILYIKPDSAWSL
ncbi:MAG: alpha/beta hydrolase [Saprospiraceae bacterium]